jgi:hypothetical protein
MEEIYKIVENNPEIFTWVFGLATFLWGAFLYFNKQSHNKAMAKLQHDLKIKEIAALPLIKKLQELEELAGEAKEIATSYRFTEQKKEHRSNIYGKLDMLSGQLSKYRPLMQAIRDLNQHCAIMAEDNPHESCREEVLEYYQALLRESENVKRSIEA